jgi:hypothetical protein
MVLVGGLPVVGHLATGVLAKPDGVAVVEVLNMSSKVISTSARLSNVFLGAESTGIVKSWRRSSNACSTFRD